MEKIMTEYTADGNFRAVVAYDVWAINPRDFDHGDYQLGVSVYTIGESNRHYHYVPSGLNTLRFEFDEMFEEHELRRDAVDAMVDHLKDKGIPYVVHSVMAERDWVADTIWYVEPTADNDFTVETINDFIEDYQAYMNGNVYEFNLQEKVVYRNEKDAEDCVIKWRTIESEGGFTDYTYQELAYFARGYGAKLSPKSELTKQN